MKHRNADGLFLVTVGQLLHPLACIAVNDEIVQLELKRGITRLEFGEKSLCRCALGASGADIHIHRQ